jgi:prolyl-tRNA synthetase
MRLSSFFLPILKENPVEASIVSHRLMLRAGMIRQLSAGIYNWLPLGLKVLKNVEKIIRQEMDKAGALELLMPCIQPAELWKESDRYNAYGEEMLRIKDRHDHDMLFAPTSEEVVVDIFRKNVFSYKELPKNFYHIQWKFRDEIRPRFGVMRGREFLMKDAYSFDIDYASAKASYDNMYITYLKIFKALGLNAIPVRANTGPIGGDLSHEFHILAATGESEVYYDASFEELAKQPEIDLEKMYSIYAAADEQHDPSNCPVPSDRLASKRGIEVGHIFYYGTKYSKSMGVYVNDKEGKRVHPEGGCYGIGVSRLLGAIIEASHDGKGIIWPDSVAPFKISIINLKPGHADCDKIAEDLYAQMQAKGVAVLYDDKEESAGSKFATHDLIGIPYQVIIGPKSAANNEVEFKIRKTDERMTLSLESLLNKLESHVL